MNKQRRHFTDHEKVAILKRHRIDKVAVSARRTSAGDDLDVRYCDVIRQSS